MFHAEEFTQDQNTAEQQYIDMSVGENTEHVDENVNPLWEKLGSSWGVLTVLRDFT